ncbi:MULTISPECIES: LacI family DNA-binding transcriptional regulator [unclassified Clostridium]|uniref:LacI family DNA-binding transcriptional regulator n=1 Tax=unclassified Clostridium TaxID=2614128 RepID=UPI000298543E|nr:MULTISPECIES: LacI family DNA-binding transcriptional regulator [unclassified Clostridium]EKQ57412.1 MAG: transcriptional regulator [Clostridium sp. Maddingley MBC34-26]
MPNKKITVQDIADELGISRNTVSKALNNTGTLAEATKSKIIQKAIEMGYKQFAYVNNASSISSNVSVNKEIALLTHSMPNNSHFGSHLLSGFEEKISTLGYRLSMYVVRDNELNSSSLPLNLNPELVDGIICIEMFDKNYCELICELGIPTLFIDSPCTHDSKPVNADILLMENYHSIYNIVKTLINNNKTTIGFVGDIYHCESFYERWKGYCSALLDLKIPFDITNSILENDKEPYVDPEWLGNKIMEIPVLPQVLICANDFIAINVIRALKHKNLSVPNDILICGFDDSMESKIIEPRLTTVRIPSYEMGDIAANLLLSRIDNPSIPFRTMHVRTSVKFRESTGNILNEINY